MGNKLKNISKRSSAGVLLFALLAVMILSANVRKAYAYFTTYATAKGGYTISLGDTTTTDEHYAGGEKIVNITSNSDSKPVWVRARAYTGAEYQDKLTYSDTSSETSKWTPSGDWYYYTEPLGPGESTGSFDESTSSYKGLVVNVSGLLEKDVEDGKNINVVIIYETVPVRYTSSGAAESWSDADWTGEVNSTTVTASN